MLSVLFFGQVYDVTTDYPKQRRIVRTRVSTLEMMVFSNCQTCQCRELYHVVLER